jgi:hypothetical protein
MYQTSRPQVKRSADLGMWKKIHICRIPYKFWGADKNVVGISEGDELEGRERDRCKSGQRNSFLRWDGQSNTS